jgi:hypothetical protein
MRGAGLASSCFSSPPSPFFSFLLAVTAPPQLNPPSSSQSTDIPTCLSPTPPSPTKRKEGLSDTFTHRHQVPPSLPLLSTHVQIWVTANPDPLDHTSQSFLPPSANNPSTHLYQYLQVCIFYRSATLLICILGHLFSLPPQPTKVPNLARAWRHPNCHSRHSGPEHCKGESFGNWVRNPKREVSSSQGNEAHTTTIKHPGK